jgi:transcription termination/antitermination protein NusA
MAVTGISANRLELLQIAEAVAREKNIEREVVIEAIEEAIQKGAKSRYGAHHDIRAKIDHKTGELALTRHVTIVEDDWQPEDELEEFNDSAMVRLTDALKRDPEAEVGKEYVENLPPFEFGRVQTQMARQVVTGKVREAERANQYEEFKDRVGEIVNGTVKRVEYGNTIVDLGRGEGIMRRDQSIPRENFNIGDRIRTYIYDVRPEAKGPQVMLSRAHPASWPSCSPRKCRKSTTASSRSAPRPVTRVRAPRWPCCRTTARSTRSAPASACAARAFRRSSPNCRARRSTSSSGTRTSPPSSSTPWRPAEVSKVVLDEEADRVEVVVPDEQLSLAIGRRGQNVRLASQLTGWQIDIITESQDSERRQREFSERTDPVPGSPGRRRGHRPAAGHRRLRHGGRPGLRRAYEIAEIEGFDEDTAEELQARARDFLDRTGRRAGRQARRTGRATRSGRCRA